MQVLAPDLKSAASVPLVGMCILLLTANLRGLRGHDSLQVSSEVTFDPFVEITKLILAYLVLQGVVVDAMLR